MDACRRAAKLQMPFCRNTGDRTCPDEVLRGTRPPMLRSRMWFALALAIVLLAVAAASLWVASSAWPATGTRRVEWLTAPVTVLRDEWSVPHIFASTPEDGAFALGWAHADDRFWQMHAMRRLGEGRLAEMIGPAALPSDRWMRTLGLYRLAQAQYPRLDPATRRLFDAYAAGVNGWLRHHRLRPLPPEFLFLRTRPEPWTPADSLVWLKLMALRLSSDWRGELLRGRLATRLSPEQIADLWPDDPQGSPTTFGNASSDVSSIGQQGSLFPLQAMFERLASALPEPPGRTHGGSNAWVVAGSGTETGLPILANDPHLGFMLPLTWYLARIVTPQSELAGATSPGFPLFLLGHNGRVAWGFTSSDVDVEDLFIERASANDASHYDAPEGPLPFDVRDEEIAVAGAGSERIAVRLTRHGPVISDLPNLRGQPIVPSPSEAPDGADTGEPADAAAPSYVLSLAAPYLRADDRTPDGLLRVNRAYQAIDVIEAARLATAPQQNVLFADVDGHVGAVTAGLVPLRPTGRGWMPQPGWTGAHDWTGFLPFEALPQALDPPSGRLVNANNRPAPADWPWPLPGSFDDGFRARRIEQRLASDGPQTLARSASLQMDPVSLAARRLLPLMLAGLPPTAADAGTTGRSETIRLLRGWDGTMARDRPEPLLFAAWLRELVRSIFADELGPAFPQWWDDHPLAVERALTTRQTWCDDVATPSMEDCSSRIESALDAALSDLARRLADQTWKGPADWRWETLHYASITHPLWDKVPLANRLADLRPEVAGGNDTVDRGAYRSADEQQPFAAVHGAGFRAVYDFADLSRSRFVLAAGQSGNPLSPHYRDMTGLWNDGEGITITGSIEALLEAGATQLHLVPLIPAGR